MANHEIKIRLTDDTSDGRFIKSNTADEVVGVATKPKTELPSTGASTPKNTIVHNLTNQTLNKISGGMYNQMSTLVSGTVNSTTIALTALGITSKMYKEWRELKQELNEYNQTRLQAGGDRGQFNMRNRRVSIFSGRVVGGQGTYVRR